MSVAPFLSLRGIHKAYGPAVAVHDCALDVAEGEFVTFLGPSGSGKSTTLYTVAGFVEPTRGEILLRGKSLLDVPPNRRDIGMVFQRYTLFPHLSVAGNVAFPLRVRGWPKARVAAKVAATLRLVRLETMADRMPGQLSGGQQQRVALARALAYDPPILLMDEPLSALDKTLREELQAEIKRIHTETGVTILYVTHDQEEALRLSDRIALFNAGRIEQLGTGHDLYRRPASRFVAGFIGNSNFLAGRLSRADRSVVLPDGTALRGLPPDALGCRGDGEVAVMVRPEHVRLHGGGGGGGGGGDGGPALHGTVAAVTYLGECTELTVSTRWGAPMSVRLFGPAAAAAPGRGHAIALTCSPADLRVF